MSTTSKDYLESARESLRQALSACNVEEKTDELCVIRRRICDAMDEIADAMHARNKTIPIYRTNERMPECNVLVIVRGGVAVWTGSVWLSKTGEDSNLVIEWSVTWWAPIIYGVKQ